MVQIDIEYQGDLRCSARHGPSGNTLVTDAPVDNMGKGQSFSPTDLLATALGTCMLTVMGIVAQKLGVDLRGTKMTVRKEMVTAPMRRVGRLTVEVRCPGGVSQEHRKRLEEAAHNCPVIKSILPEIETPTMFTWG